MTTKKSKKANLEKKKTIFFQIGLIFSLALVFLAFEWKSFDKVNDEWSNDNFVIIEDDMVDITIPEPPKQIIERPQTTTIEIVDDDEADDNIEINIEDNMNVEVMEFIPEVNIIEKPKEKEIFTVVEEPPVFIGGDEKLYKFLGDNMIYPQMARESGIQGIVYVTFVVEPNGAITSVRVLRDIGGGCGEEATRVVNAMPKWSPGKQRGIAVRVQFNLPVKFTLQG
jgi:periplasmic protein TonB